ncbi:hypothetical protein N7488_000550 [Penicillium malachiteum]|nr:hypothetical protein N7488_000550 [Penicillium malachiteum]
MVVGRRENTLRSRLATNDLPEQWRAHGSDLQQLLLIELLTECDEETLLLMVMVLQSHQDLLRDLMTTKPPGFTRLNGDLLPKAERFDTVQTCTPTSKELLIMQSTHQVKGNLHELVQIRH